MIAGLLVYVAGIVTGWSLCCTRRHYRRQVNRRAARAATDARRRAAARDRILARIHAAVRSARS